MNIIQQLKANEKPVCFMSLEMREKAKEIGKTEFYWLDPMGDWVPIVGDDHFTSGCTYRLRDTYAEEPEIVECEIYDQGNERYFLDNGEPCRVHVAPASVHFVGFKFMDGTVSGSPVKYSVPGITSRGYYAFYDDIKTKQALEHHASHVLFRRLK